MIKSNLGGTAALLSVLGLATPAAAQNFDDSSIRGTWALAVDGFVAAGTLNNAGLADPSPGTPIFAIGRVIFDGEGGCESDDQLVVGNVATPEDPRMQRTATQCMYEVQSNGYGFFEVTFENPPDIDDPEGDDMTTTTARFIIEKKKEISFIADNAELGIFGGGTLVRQSRRIN
jgi:hypothetical protein